MSYLTLEQIEAAVRDAQVTAATYRSLSPRGDVSATDLRDMVDAVRPAFIDSDRTGVNFWRALVSGHLGIGDTPIAHIFGDGVERFRHVTRASDCWRPVDRPSAEARRLAGVRT